MSVDAARVSEWRCFQIFCIRINCPWHGGFMAVQCALLWRYVFNRLYMEKWVNLNTWGDGNVCHQRIEYSPKPSRHEQWDSLVFGFIHYLTITKRGHLCATCNVYFGRRHLQMFTNIYSSSKYSFTVVRYHYSADIRDSCDWRYKPSMLYSIGDISWNTLYSLPFWSNLAPAFKLHGVFQWCGGAIALIILVILILFECFIHTYQQAHATNAVWLTKKSPVSALRCSRACQFIVI